MGLPPRLTERGGRAVPAIVLYQLLHLREDRFGERARVPVAILRHLDVNEDAEDVLPEALAVVIPLDVPDPVLRLVVVPGLLDVEDYVGEVLLAGLHLAEDDVPFANLAGLLLDRVDAILRCYSLDGVEIAGVVRLDQGPHRIPRAHVEGGAALSQILPNQPVPRVPKPELKLFLQGVVSTAFHGRPILVE